MTPIPLMNPHLTPPPPTLLPDDLPSVWLGWEVLLLKRLRGGGGGVGRGGGNGEASGW